MSEEVKRSITPASKSPNLRTAYLAGVIIGNQFVSGGKCLFIVDDQESENDRSVYSGNLFEEASDEM